MFTRCLLLLVVLFATTVGCRNQADIPKGSGSTGALEKPTGKGNDSGKAAVQDTATTTHWRDAEKKFLALLGFEDYDKTFKEWFHPGYRPIAFADEWTNIMDKNGNTIAWEWVAADPKLKKLTAEEIRQKCGAPHVSFDKEVYYGRLGYKSEDGKAVSKLLVVDTIERIKERAK